MNYTFIKFWLDAGAKPAAIGCGYVHVGRVVEYAPILGSTHSNENAFGVGIEQTPSGPIGSIVKDL